MDFWNIAIQWQNPELAIQFPAPALSSDRVATGGKHLGNARGAEAGFRQTEGRSQPGATCTDNDDIVAMVNELVIAHASSPILIIA